MIGKGFEHSTCPARLDLSDSFLLFDVFALSLDLLVRTYLVYNMLFFSELTPFIRLFILSFAGGANVAVSVHPNDFPHSHDGRQQLQTVSVLLYYSFSTEFCCSGAGQGQNFSSIQYIFSVFQSLTNFPHANNNR